MPAALDEVDGVDVVGVNDTGAAQSTHGLRENVPGDLAPGEVPEGGEGDGHRRVDVAWGDPSRDPYAQGEADGESEVDRQGVLHAHGEVKVISV